jgi:hypothetical protein
MAEETTEAIITTARVEAGMREEETTEAIITITGILKKDTNGFLI